MVWVLWIGFPNLVLLMKVNVGPQGTSDTPSVSDIKDIVVWILEFYFILVPLGKPSSLFTGQKTAHLKKYCPYT